MADRLGQNVRAVPPEGVLPIIKGSVLWVPIDGALLEICSKREEGLDIGYDMKVRVDHISGCCEVACDDKSASNMAGGKLGVILDCDVL